MALSEPMIGGTQACQQERATGPRRPLLSFFHPFWYGLATKWALYTAILGMVVTAALTSYMYQGSVDALIDGELHELAATNQAAGLRFDAEIAFARQDAVILADSPAFAGLVRARANGGVDPVDGLSERQAFAYLAATFRTILIERPDYLQLRYIATDGHEIMRTERLSGGEVQLAPEQTLRDLSGRSYFIETVGLPKGKAHISDFGLLQPNGQIEKPYRSVVRVAAPAYDANNSLLGVVVINVDLDKMFDIVTETVRQQAFHFIANQDGDYLYQPDPRKTFGFLLGQRYMMQDDLPQLASLFAENGSTYSGTVTLRGKQYVTDARRIYYDTRQPDRFMVLATLRPESYVSEDITALTNRTLLIAGVMLVVGTLAVVGLARRLVHPLHALTDATTRIAAGDQEIQVSAAARRKDEIGRLARSIETMAADIRSREEAIQRNADDLARTNKELTQFAYVASHDLQEPLRMVDSYLNLLERRYGEKFDGEAHEFIGYAVDGARRMKRLINDLLAYSRVSNRPLGLEKVDIAAIVADVVDALAERLVESGGEIVAGPLPIVEGDPVQMERLFSNLIGNAVKYRGEARPEIRVSAERKTGMWEFSVADNGIGIDPEFREKVFDIFTRLHSREHFPGSGIGLASCRRIVERHGGSIWVETTPGGGTTLRFTLPIHMAAGEGVDA